MIRPKTCRAARALLGWSQKKLAETAGVTQQTVANFEAERNRPIPKTLERLQAAMESAGIRFSERGVKIT
jgi:transcriptional regulator with XRE-family HTH domain